MASIVVLFLFNFKD